MTSIRRPISPRCSIAWRVVIPTTGSTNSCPGTSSPCWPRPPDRAAYPADFANNSLNSRSLSARPSSVSTTDFALPTGSQIIPFRYRRSRASQSWPFHALNRSCSVRWSSASTASSILSLSMSTAATPGRSGIVVPDSPARQHVDWQTLTIRTIVWSPKAVPEIRAAVSSAMSDLTKPDYADHTVILKPKRATPLAPLFVRTERDGIERVYPFAFEAVENAEAPYVVRITNPADAVAAQRAAAARRRAAAEQQRA